MPGGFANQPIGYVSDVMRVRNYQRALEDVDREEAKGADAPASEWAHEQVNAVDAEIQKRARRRRAREAGIDEDDAE